MKTTINLLITAVFIYVLTAGTFRALVTYAGGDGTSIEEAVIIIGAQDDREGVDSEYI